MSWPYVVAVLIAVTGLCVAALSPRRIREWSLAIPGLRGRLTRDNPDSSFKDTGSTHRRTTLRSTGRNDVQLKNVHSEDSTFEIESGGTSNVDE